MSIRQLGQLVYVNEQDVTAPTLTTSNLGVVATNPVSLASVSLNSAGFTPTGLTQTLWTDTHTTVARTPSLTSGSNSTILALKNKLLVLDVDITPTCAIGIQADNTGGVGTAFGIDITNTANNNDFVIQTDPSYTGSVVFKEFGSGASTTQTAIKQGTITVSDTATAPNTVITDTSIVINENFSTTTPNTATLTSGNLEIKNVNGPALTTTTTDINPANIVLADTGQPTTTFTTTTLTSGAASATWADIISGAAGDNTLQEVLTAGNTASNLNITLTGPSGSSMTLSPVSNNLGAIETFTPVVPFNTAQSLISLGASSGNLTSTMDIFDNTTPISYQISGQIVQAGDRINDVYNVKPEVQLFTQYIDGMGTILKTAKYQVSGITHQSTTPYEINSPANVGITANNVILTSNNLTSTTDTLTVRSGGFGYTTNPNIIIENTLFSAGNTVGVPSVEYYKSGRITVLNDVVMSQQFNARAYNNVKTTFGKIECSITGNSAPTGIDGALDFYTCINGVNQNVMRLNGADNENNTFRPFDLNGNALKTSQGDMTIDTTASTGPGLLTLNSKQSLLLNSGGGSGIQINTSGGNLAINTSTTGGIQLTGTALQSATSGGNSGQHLVITLNGTPYKIALQNP